MIRQVQADGRDAAIRVHQLRGNTGASVIHHVLVAGELGPLRIALVARLDVEAHGAIQRLRRLHAFHFQQRPLQLVRQVGGGEARALLLRGLEHHHEHIGTGAVVVQQVGVVPVVAGLGTKLRRAGIEVADLQVLPRVVADPEQQQTAKHQRNGVARFDHRGEAAEHRPGGLRSLPLLRHAARADADIGHQHRQQEHLGEDGDEHADAGSDRQLLDHADVDHQQGDEADGIGQQRGGAGNEQGTEGALRGLQWSCSAAHLAHHQVDVLHRMADADGEDQEWHQD
ncbi:hypothetical protein D9M71_460020 [compost metagenome]